MTKIPISTNYLLFKRPNGRFVTAEICLRNICFYATSMESLFEWEITFWISNHDTVRRTVWTIPTGTYHGKAIKATGHNTKKRADISESIQNTSNFQASTFARKFSKIFFLIFRIG